MHFHYRETIQVLRKIWKIRWRNSVLKEKTLGIMIMRMILSMTQMSWSLCKPVKREANWMGSLLSRYPFINALIISESVRVIHRILVYSQILYTSALVLKIPILGLFLVLASWRRFNDVFKFSSLFQWPT